MFLKPSLVIGRVSRLAIVGANMAAARMMTEEPLPYTEPVTGIIIKMIQAIAAASRVKTIILFYTKVFSGIAISLL